MSSSKKIDLKRDFAAAVYLSEAQNLIPIHGILIHTGKGQRREGGRLNQRES
jgi:hypothetical protein